MDVGFAASSAAGVLVWVNVGGATGGLVLGLLTQRFGVKALTIGVLALSTFADTAFGQAPADLQRLAFICAVAGFCMNAGIIGVYAIIAQTFPTHVRAFGTGSPIGTDRMGSVPAPILAGVLFAAGYGLPAVATMMALGSLCAAGILMWLRLDPAIVRRPGHDPARGTAACRQPPASVTPRALQGGKAAAYPFSCRTG